ncbi:hypothetical protein GGQ87_001329 [Brevundimonas alba]|uniref:Lipoprotein n=1 Tax=Brevundimonas alba TaxID=74314 RepID=A0A7X5YKU6_9CAUL|nr:hypothetical protein [Brevundimonas alba]NJC41071.1 hypothetical protein [Brevundimonas alba]
MRIGVVVAAAALWLSACGAPEAPPVLIEASQVKPLLEFSDELDGKRVMLDGYIHIDDGPDEEGGIAILYTLTSRPRGQGDDLILFEAERGTAANQVDTPLISQRSIPQMPGAGEILLVDLKNAKFQDTAGVAHTVRDKVRVTGRVASFSGVDDDRSPTGKRFRPRLTDVTFEAAP